MGQQRFSNGRRVIGVVVLAVVASMAGIGSASAAPATVPAPVQRLAEASGHSLVGQHLGRHSLAATHAGSAQQVRAGERRALRADDEDEPFVGVEPGCASGTGKAEVEAYVYTPTKLKADYVLTDTGVVKTGTVKTKAGRPVDVTLPSLRIGTYRLVLTVQGTSDVLGDTTFDVLPCVQVKASCAAVSLTNPAGNPSALVSYGGKYADAFDLVLAPGETRSVRVDDKKVTFVASSTGTDENEDVVFLGHVTVKVKQSCKHGSAQPGQNAVQTTVISTCAGVAGRSGAVLSWAVQPSVKDKTQIWQILDAQQVVVATGSYKNGGRKTVSLPAGTYTYRSSANAPAQTFEELAVPVLDCVTVTTDCHLIKVTNPNAVPVDAYLIDTDEDSDVVDPGEAESFSTVAPASTASIDWRTRSAVLLAIAGGTSDASHVISFASDFPLDDEQDFPEITIPQDC